MLGSYTHTAEDANHSPNARLNRQGITISPPPDQEAEADLDFYVTVLDSGRVGWLLGPFPTLAEATENVGRGHDLAIAANDWASFYSFGTASLPKGTPRTVVFSEMDV